MKVLWTRRAQRDLQEIRSYIARDNPAAAQRWVNRLRERAEQAAAFPLAGRKVPELNLESLREVLVGGYRIVYRIQPAALEILTVFEGHRLLPLANVPPEE